MLAVSSNQLGNGLGVVTVEQPHLHATQVSFFVRCGSRHESNQQWGLSHLVEHMLFRGSARYPTAKNMARALERHGGTINASTWRDHTLLTTAIHPARLREALMVLSDVVQRPRFADLDVERAIVEEELNGDLDADGQDKDINNVSRSTIWNGHPIGRRIAGSHETVRAFDDHDIRAHHQQHYVASNAVLCVAGRVAASETEALAEEAFGDLTPGVRTHDGDPARFGATSRLCARDAEGSQLQVQLAFGALPDGHVDFHALSLLTRILDDGVSSRLHEAVVERKGLVYELNTGLDCYADCGLYDIEMTVAPRRAASAVATTLEALECLCSEGVREEELELARDRTLYELEFSCDSAEEMSTHYGSAALFAGTEPPEVLAPILQAIDVADIERVARRVFTPDQFHVTVLGPLQRANMKRIEKLICGFAPGSTG